MIKQHVYHCSTTYKFNQLGSFFQMDFVFMRSKIEDYPDYADNAEQNHEKIPPKIFSSQKSHSKPKTAYANGKNIFEQI